jgi:hypothetical protein
MSEYHEYRVRMCRSYVFEGHCIIKARSQDEAIRKGYKLIDDTVFGMSHIDEGRDYVEVERLSK